jgi:hypothetical protein
MVRGILRSSAASAAAFGGLSNACLCDLTAFLFRALPCGATCDGEAGDCAPTLAEGGAVARSRNTSLSFIALNWVLSLNKSRIKLRWDSMVRPCSTTNRDIKPYEIRNSTIKTGSITLFFFGRTIASPIAKVTKGRSDLRSLPSSWRNGKCSFAANKDAGAN